MINTNKYINNLQISYETKENGYSIYLGDKLWITQYDEYSKPIDKTKTIEENCLLQIEELTNVVNETQSIEERLINIEMALLTSGGII